MGAFFGEWETAINTAVGFEAPEAGRILSKEDVQFATHKYYL